MSDNPQEKKIIIDEDWKSQVETEKKKLAEERQQEKPGEPTGETPEDMRMPEASFAMLITTLASEAMMGLGQIPHPMTGKAEVSLEQAKYFIDTLEILEAKTKGNLSAEEQQALQGMLYQLRMAFVAAKKEAGEATTG